VVLFAHGSGSSRLSPRNRFVAQHLNRAGLATLLLDLLTEGEERSEAQTGELRFDIDLLASRLLAATHWLRAHPETAALPLGYFGASTGAGAALAAAALLGREVSAIVSRGGRPDLAGQDRLTQVTTPTLLIVGGADPEVLDLNRVALRFLPPPSRLEVVPGAGHLFEGPGELEAVADLASRWFDRCLAGPTAHPSAP
jgi:dienelactone hydrolase